MSTIHFSPKEVSRGLCRLCAPLLKRLTCPEMGTPCPSCERMMTELCPLSWGQQMFSLKEQIDCKYFVGHVISGATIHSAIVLQKQP